MSSQKQYLIFSKDDLVDMFPWEKTKTNEILNSGVFPFVKIGRDYITNEKELDNWFKKYSGKEIQYK